MRKVKKLISLFLALVMVVTCVTSVAFAEEAEEAGVTVTKFNVLNGTTLDTIEEAKQVFSGADSLTMVPSPVENGSNALQISSGKTVAVRKTAVDSYESYWPAGNRPTKISFDLKNTSGTGLGIGYFILADASGNGVGNSVRDNDGGLFSKRAKMVSGTASEVDGGTVGYKFCGRNYVEQNDDAYAEIKPYENAHYEYEFSYSSTDVTIKLTITGVVQATSGTYKHGSGTREFQNDNTATAERSFKITDYGLDTTTLTPTFITNETGSMILDNFTVKSYADEAVEYLNLYEELFNKNSNDVTPDDAAAAAEARAAYNALSDDAKTVLTKNSNVETFLNAVDEKIAALTAIEKANAYVNTYSTVVNKAVADMTDKDLITFAQAIDAHDALGADVQDNDRVVALKATIDENDDAVLARIKTLRSVDFSSSKWIRTEYLKDTGATVEDKDTFITYKGAVEFGSTDTTPLTHVEFTWQYPAGPKDILFYPVSSDTSNFLKAKSDGESASGYDNWICGYGSAKTFGSDLKYTPNKGENNGLGLWNISAKNTPGWAKFEFDYDWSAFTESKKVTVKTTATFTGRNVLLSNGTTTGYIADSKDDTYKSVVYKTFTLNDADPTAVKFKLDSSSAINIKEMGVQTAKSAADSFNNKYSTITAESKNFVTAKAEFENLNAKAEEHVRENIRTVLEKDTTATFAADDFSNAATSAVNWVGGVVTPSFDRDTANLTKKNTLFVSGSDKATLTEAVWPKGTRPAYMSVTFSSSGEPYIVFAGDKERSANGGFGVYIEGSNRLKTATFQNGSPSVLGNYFFIGSSVAYNENGNMIPALRSGNYDGTRWTTLDMKFDYSVSGKVGVIMDIYMYNSDVTGKVVFSSVKRTYTVGEMTDFRPYFFANNGFLKIADFKYYTEEQLANNTVFANEGANIYRGTTEDKSNAGCLSFSGSVAVNGSIAYKALTETGYARNIGNEALINGHDTKIEAGEIDTLLPITEIGAKVWAKTNPTEADKKTVSVQTNASFFGVVIKGTNVDPTSNSGKNASSIKVHTQLYVKIGDKTVESKEPISMSRHKALRKTAADCIINNKTNGETVDYTDVDALNSKIKYIEDIEEDVYRWLQITR